MRYRFQYFGADLRLTSPHLNASASQHYTTSLCIMRCSCYCPAFAGYSMRLLTKGWLRLSRPGSMVPRRRGLRVLKRSPETPSMH